MPEFNKRNGQWQIRFKKSGRSPSEKSESMPLSTPVAKVRQVEGQMNAAYYGEKWDPWKLSWKEYQKKIELEQSGILETSLTLSDACKLYMKDMVLQNRIKSGKTKYQYEQKLDMFRDWIGENLPVNELTPDHAGRWLQSLDIAQSTREYYGAVVSGLYQYLNEKGFINHSFRYYRKSNNDRASKIKYITEAQKDEICEFYRENRNDLMQDRRTTVPDWMDWDGLINILFYQGLRKGEIFDNKVLRRDINIGESKMIVTGKWNKTRKIDITPPAAEFIKRAYMKTSDPAQNIFPHPPRVFRRLLKRLAKKKLGEEYSWISPHNLRHSCGTYWASQGVPVTVIQKLLGHKNINTTMVYVEITDDTSQNAFQSAYYKNANVRSING